MAGPLAIDQQKFRRILMRNVALPLGIGVVTAAVFIALIFYLLSSMNWVEHSERVIGNANELAKLAVDRETGMRGYPLTGDENYLAPYRLGRARFQTELTNLRELVGDNASQVEQLQRIDGFTRQWNEFAEEVIGLRRKNQPFLPAMSGDRGKVEFDQIRREFQAFMDVERRLRDERSASAQSIVAITVILFLAISLSLSAFLALFGRRELTQLSRSYGDALEEQEQVSRTLQQQAWLRDGQRLLAERVIGQQALELLGRTILDFMAGHVHSDVAALYARAGDGSLRRVAAYGFSRESEEATQAFTGTQTLVGQAAANARLIHLDEVPSGYFKVASGLGEGKPAHVVLVPVDNDGAVNGVLELGFLHAPQPRDIEFLQLVASNIGAFVEAALYRQRLQDVLAETQQLNEELQVQQEELRTANEELEEQSKVLEESQANLENQKSELEQINEQLARQAVSLDQKNEALNVAHAQLEERADDLQRASRYKSEFLANMSHELRTPLNSSLILAKLLSENQKGNLDAEQVRFAQTIYSAGNDLLNLINDILDISKVEAGKLDLNPEVVPLRKLAESLQATFEPLATQKGLQFSVRVDATAPVSVFTDRHRVEQIMKNLLSNAIKFTEAGSVVLAVDQDSGGNVRFSVQDSGIGIALEHQQSIFEAFRQADGTTSRRYGGTGLGLTISRDLAALLGGAIHVDSAPGQGSTFTLALPPVFMPARSDSPVAAAAPRLAPAAAPTPAAASTVINPVVPQPPAAPVFEDDRYDASPAPRSVLVIEDEPEFARILFDLAHEMQFRCYVAHTAGEGLHMATQYRPDAILLDVHLPDGSGLTLLQQMKEDPQLRHVPVHVVSASDRADTALYMGAIGYAVKPTTRDQLAEIFHKLEEKITQKVKHVLLVEDDLRQRESIVQLIGDDDVEITAVEYGEEALKLLESNVYDCMVIDLKLPDMQGGELLRRMSIENIRSFPPVIVYTGRTLTREEELDLLKYSKSIIIKGARSPERLLDEVTLFLHKVEAQMSNERQTMLKTVRSRDRVFDGRKVLLVDDDIRNIFALTSALEHRGITVEIGRNGFEAIDKLNEVPDIDLVLMDVMMPVMDGLEATRRIRTDPRFAKTPIIAITAKAMRDDQEQCLKAGTTDYLAKPIDLDRLFSLMRVWMPSQARG